MGSPQHEERLKETCVYWLGALDQYSAVIHCGSATYLSMRMLLNWLWMSDILYMYVFCVKNPSDVARSRFIAVVCLKLTPRGRRTRRWGKKGSWRLTVTWSEVVAVRKVFLEMQRRLKLYKVRNIVTWQLFPCFSPDLQTMCVEFRRDCPGCRGASLKVRVKKTVTTSLVVGRT